MNSDIPGENETPLSVPAVLQQAFDALPYAVIVGTSRADPHGARIVYVNDALTDLLHYTRQELLGRPPPMLDAYQAPSEAAKFDVYDSDLDRARSFEGTFWSYPKDGDPIRLTWGVSPLRDEAGRVVGFIGIHASATLTESDAERRESALGPDEPEIEPAEQDAFGALESIAAEVRLQSGAGDASALRAALERIGAIAERAMTAPAAGAMSAQRLPVATLVERATRQNEVLGALPPRQRQVLIGILSGESNKEIASRLKISHRTVEAHRRALMQALGAEKAVDLARIVFFATSP